MLVDGQWGPVVPEHFNIALMVVQVCCAKSCPEAKQRENVCWTFRSSLRGTILSPCVTAYAVTVHFVMQLRLYHNIILHLK